MGCQQWPSIMMERLCIFPLKNEWNVFCRGRVNRRNETGCKIFGPVMLHLLSQHKINKERSEDFNCDIEMERMRENFQSKRPQVYPPGFENRDTNWGWMAQGTVLVSFDVFLRVLFGTYLNLGDIEEFRHLFRSDSPSPQPVSEQILMCICLILWVSPRHSFCFPAQSKMSFPCIQTIGILIHRLCPKWLPIYTTGE